MRVVITAALISDNSSPTLELLLPRFGDAMRRSGESVGRIHWNSAGN